MVKYNETQLDQVFSALSDPTRRAIVSRLANGKATVGELAEPFGISLPAVSKHLRVLESARLINRTIEGRVHHCELNAEPLQQAEDWIEHHRQFWTSRLDDLARYLENTPKEKKHGQRRKTRRSKS